MRTLPVTHAAASMFPDLASSDGRRGERVQHCCGFAALLGRPMSINSRTVASFCLETHGHNGLRL